MTTPPAPPISAPTPGPTLSTEVPADCTPASQDLIDQVDAHLAPNGQHLMDASVVTGLDDYTYVGGNVMEGDRKASSADVWVAVDDWVLYALSGSAREETPSLADGRNLGLSAGDEIGLGVQECSIAAYRVRQ